MLADIASTNFFAAAVECRQHRQRTDSVRPSAPRPVRAACAAGLKEKISAALALPNGWAGPGSVTPSVEIAYRVESLVIGALSGLDDPHLPFIVPMADGGLQVEWHQNGADLEVAFFGSGEVSGVFEDRVAGGEIESDGTEALDLLLRYARRVAQNAGNALDAQVAQTQTVFALSA